MKCWILQFVCRLKTHAPMYAKSKLKFLGTCLRNVSMHACPQRYKIACHAILHASNTSETAVENFDSYPSMISWSIMISQLKTHMLAHESHVLFYHANLLLMGLWHLYWQGLYEARKHWNKRFYSILFLYGSKFSLIRGDAENLGIKVTAPTFLKKKKKNSIRSALQTIAYNNADFLASTLPRGNLCVLGLWMFWSTPHFGKVVFYFSRLIYRVISITPIFRPLKAMSCKWG